jgi:hypothetical protein
MDKEKNFHCTTKPNNKWFAKKTIDVSHGNFQSFLLQIQTKEKACNNFQLKNIRRK